jgi:hypothetical protein
MGDNNLLRTLFSPLTIIGVVLVGGLLFAITLFLVWTFSPVASAQAPATAVFTVIVAPSVTPTQPTATPAPPATPTSPVPPAPPQGSISTGGYVQISGTGGDGLRLRVDPGLASEVRFVAIEAEVFRVDDGPRDVDGYVWWYLVAPADETRRGWAVSNYLAQIQNP